MLNELARIWMLGYLSAFGPTEYALLDTYERRKAHADGAAAGARDKPIVEERAAGFAARLTLAERNR